MLVTFLSLDDTHINVFEIWVLGLRVNCSTIELGSHFTEILGNDLRRQLRLEAGTVTGSGHPPQALIGIWERTTASGGYDTTGEGGYHGLFPRRGKSNLEGIE